MSVFIPADILLPQVDFMEKWSVIACDQFTSQPEYWERVRAYVGEAPSTLHIILPEAELTEDCSGRIERINRTMGQYLQGHIFKEYANAFIYVERTLKNGMIRRGVVGAVDLEEYDYDPESMSCVRATEKTVVERIPPRKKIRREALLELPHILLLCDDEERALIESAAAIKQNLPKVYEFDLMEDGGHIAGWLLQGEDMELFCGRLKEYEKRMRDEKNLLYAVGDGNHSLAAAKACYEDIKRRYLNGEWKNHPARYALAELGNIYDSAQRFEPIHRIVKETAPEELMKCMKKEICAAEGHPLVWYSGGERGTVFLDKNKGENAVGILQTFLDKYLMGHDGEIDYIHGDEALQGLAKEEHAIGFLLPGMEKGQLFRGIMENGALPRKTFSIGEAVEKRYYLEARRIASFN